MSELLFSIISVRESMSKEYDSLMVTTLALHVFLNLLIYPPPQTLLHLFFVYSLLNSASKVAFHQISKTVATHLV